MALLARNHPTHPATMLKHFETYGYVERIAVLSPTELINLQEALNQLLHQIRTNPSQRRKGLHLTERFVYNLTTHPLVLKAVTTLIGPNILLWGSNVICKYPGDGARIAWHQDARAWPLAPDKTVTVWLALDKVDEMNGAMQVLPGSHHHGLFNHDQDSLPGNLLDKNLAIVDEVLDVSQAVTLTLDAGEASIHHANLVHGSPPNRSSRRRCGLAIRYMPPDVRKIDPTRWPDFSTVLVQGEDSFRFSPKATPFVTKA